MRNKKYIIIFIIFILFSCDKSNDYDVDISNLRDRLIDIDDKINSINLDIDLLQTKINNQSKELGMISGYEKSDQNNEKSKLKRKKDQFVDPEALFKKTYKTKRISEDGCALIDLSAFFILPLYSVPILISFACQVTIFDRRSFASQFCT